MTLLIDVSNVIMASNERSASSYLWDFPRFLAPPVKHRHGLLPHCMAPSKYPPITLFDGWSVQVIGATPCHLMYWHQARHSIDYVWLANCKIRSWTVIAGSLSKSPQCWTPMYPTCVRSFFSVSLLGCVPALQSYFTGQQCGQV